MYLCDTLQGDRMRLVAREERPSGPSFSNNTLFYAVRMEIWHSCLEDDGPGFTEFRLYDAKNLVVAIARVFSFEDPIPYIQDSVEEASSIGTKDDANDLLKLLLTPEQYSDHLTSKEVQKQANWQTVIDELPVEAWRRKAAKKKVTMSV